MWKWEIEQDIKFAKRQQDFKRKPDILLFTKDTLHTKLHTGHANAMKINVWEQMQYETGQ